MKSMTRRNFLTVAERLRAPPRSLAATPVASRPSSLLTTRLTMPLRTTPPMATSAS